MNPWRCLHTSPAGERLYMRDGDPCSEPDAIRDCPRLFLCLPGAIPPDREFSTRIEVDYHDMVRTTPTHQPAMIAVVIGGSRADLNVSVPILVNDHRLSHWSNVGVSISIAYKIAQLWGIPVLLRASGIPDTYLNIPGCEVP